MLRAARSNETGEVFMECPHSWWSAALSAWKKDHSQPAPMPVGHIMFDGDMGYQAGFWKYEQFIPNEPCRQPKSDPKPKPLQDQTLDGLYSK